MTLHPTIGLQTATRWSQTRDTFFVLKNENQRKTSSNKYFEKLNKLVRFFSVLVEDWDS